MKRETIDAIESSLDLTRLAKTPEEVARLTRSERAQRVRELTKESHALLDDAMDVFFEKHTLKGVVILFSGGNDSTVLADLFRTRATHAAHANTTIGVEATREFVRDTCRKWGLPLLEHTPPPGSTYRELVLDQGFPGPGHHYKMFQRLKERALMQVRRDLVTNPRQERVIYLAGRRRTESARRANIPEFERRGSIVWVSPMVNWTKLDMNTYRLMVGDVPVNRVTDMIHMSGECLCGSFAHEGELDELREWFPDVVGEIEQLERDVLAEGKHPEYRCRWGWGAIPELAKQARADERDPSKTGVLCQSCDARARGGEIVGQIVNDVWG